MCVLSAVACVFSDQVGTLNDDAVLTASELYTATQGQQFLKTQCGGCHSGKAAAGNFDIAKLAQPDSVRVRSAAWSKAALRVRNGEMPPKSTLSMDAREGFFAGVSESLRTEACAAGVVPGPLRPGG